MWGRRQLSGRHNISIANGGSVEGIPADAGAVDSSAAAGLLVVGPAAAGASGTPALAVADGSAAASL